MGLKGLTRYGEHPLLREPRNAFNNMSTVRGDLILGRPRRMTRKKGRSRLSQVYGDEIVEALFRTRRGSKSLVPCWTAAIRPPGICSLGYRESFSLEIS